MDFCDSRAAEREVALLREEPGLGARNVRCEPLEMAHRHEPVLPALDEQLARGEFSGLFDWLRTHVHGLGAKVPVQELLKSATGKPLAATSFIRYVEAKYLESSASSAAA